MTAALVEETLTHLQIHLEPLQHKTGLELGTLLAGHSQVLHWLGGRIALTITSHTLSQLTHSH